MKRVSGWLAMIAWLIAARGLAAAEGTSSPVFTSKVRFRIPFRYDAAEMQRLQAREVQLFVSDDQGTRWRMSEKVEPRAEHFDFVAPRDGEYWFAVRTLDAFNRLHPQGNNVEPGLKVIVDSTRPTLELTLDEVEPGKVELQWDAADDHLDATKLRLEYRQPDSPDWQQVGVVPQASGRTTWTVPSGGVVAVRGSVSDSAGNSTTAEKERNVRPAARAPQKGPETEYRSPVAGMEGQFSRSDAPPDSRKDVVDSEPSIRPQRKSDLVSDSPESRPAIVQKQRPAATDPVSPADKPASDEETAQTEAPPTNPRAVFVNRRDFQIGYRVDEVGPSGVGKVELFITQDGGGKWYRYGTDPDSQSPFAVSVPADGVYGFELRVKNGAGIGDEPPRAGDKPSIVVTVDKTAPIAQLSPPQIGRGNSRNKVQIQWTASDEHLGPAPILLQYATEPGGPWEKISDWQPNTGRYIWSLGERLPGKVLLRITVRDEAGNVTEVVSPDPLIIDFTKPTARIVDIEAKSSEKQRN